VALIRQAGGEATFVRCNVTVESDVQQLMASTVDTYGRLDYAFNNAGIEIEKGKLADGTSSTRSWASTSRASGCA
jgi:NAD(P)-dependent dehydrogenase (short-subunit alcohol dehydrogenase family)